MSFSSFISSISSAFNSTFNGIINLIDPILQNNFIKLIIFLVLIYLGIEFLDKIIGIILNIFSQKKSVSKEKSTNKNTDIE